MPPSQNRFDVLSTLAESDSKLPARQIEAPGTLKSSRGVWRSSEDEPIRSMPRSIERSLKRTKKSAPISAKQWPLTQLCTSCERIFDSHPPKEWYDRQIDRWHDYQPDPVALKEAASLGCGLCYLVQKKFSEMGLLVNDSSSASVDDRIKIRYNVQETESLDLSLQVGYMLPSERSVSYNELLADLTMVRSQGEHTTLPHSSLSLSETFRCRATSAKQSYPKQYKQCSNMEPLSELAPFLQDQARKMWLPPNRLRLPPISTS